MDIIEIEEGDGARPPDISEVPIEAILKQHRLRYVVMTAQGGMVLKFIGALRRSTVELTLQSLDPEYNNRRKGLRETTRMLKEDPGNPRLISEQKRLAAELEPSFYVYFAACFERPKGMSGEAVLALASALPPNEWGQLRSLLLQLVAARPEGEVATEMVSLCARYGVPIVDGLALDSMTAQQLSVLGLAADREAAAIREAAKR